MFRKAPLRPRSGEERGRLRRRLGRTPRGAGQPRDETRIDSRRSLNLSPGVGQENREKASFLLQRWYFSIRRAKLSTLFTREATAGIIEARGGMAEWSNAAVLKIAEAQVSGGSNPSPSVSTEPSGSGFRPRLSEAPGYHLATDALGCAANRLFCGPHHSPYTTRPIPSLTLARNRSVREFAAFCRASLSPCAQRARGRQSRHLRGAPGPACSRCPT
jgi:hypothetical protein